MLYLPDGVKCKASKYQELVREPDLRPCPSQARSLNPTSYIPTFPTSHVPTTRAPLEVGASIPLDGAKLRAAKCRAFESVLAATATLAG